MSKMDQEHIQKVLLKCQWKVSKAAQELDISHPALHDLIKRYQIVKDPVYNKC